MNNFGFFIVIDLLCSIDLNASCYIVKPHDRKLISIFTLQFRSIDCSVWDFNWSLLDLFTRLNDCNGTSY